MNIHIDADGGLVSNPSDREIQGTSALAAHAAALDLDVSNLSWVEPHVGKRDIGHLSNRKLTDPSASESRIPAHLSKSTLPFKVSKAEFGSDNFNEVLRKEFCLSKIPPAVWDKIFPQTA